MTENPSLYIRILDADAGYRHRNYEPEIEKARERVIAAGGRILTRRMGQDQPIRRFEAAPLNSL